MGNETLDQRLLKLELIVEGHHEDLKELRDASKMLKQSLEAIESTLQQIKYLAIGGAAVLIANEVGITQAIKKILL